MKFSRGMTFATSLPLRPGLGSSATHSTPAQGRTGQGVEEHMNDRIEVIVVGVSGAEIVTVDQQEHNLSAGMLVFIPKGTRRATVSTSEDFAYLTVHHRRRPLWMGLSLGA